MAVFCPVQSCKSFKITTWQFAIHLEQVKMMHVHYNYIFIWQIPNTVYEGFQNIPYDEV